MQDREDSQAQINPATSPFEPLGVPDASLIVRSSDRVDFRVHKPVLATASPFFKDLLSPTRLSDSESVDGLPIVQLPESSELLNSLLTMLYPDQMVMPNSYDKVLYFAFDSLVVITNTSLKVLYLLAACQKYEMVSVQSFIRAEISRGVSPAPNGAEALRAFGIASAKELIPEMENAARLTLDHPMTFEIFGEWLELFEGSALRDLVKFRRRCRDNLITSLDLFFKSSGPSRIWTGCPDVMVIPLPRWLYQVFTRNWNDLKLQMFTHPLDIHKRIRQEYLTALQSHGNCNFCLKTHIRHGSTFCAELENKLAQALDKVTRLLQLSSIPRFTPL